MNAPEASQTTEPQLADRLLEYDAALADGEPPSGMLSSDLPEEFREGFACLEMLERLRLSNSEMPRREQPTQLGRFEILRILGQGGCGMVFLARDPLLNRSVALKIPRWDAFLTPEARQRFLREGRAVGCLDHPNLVPVFEAGEIGAVCYLASPYCPGITLRDWLRQHAGPVSPHAAAWFIATVADAMHHAHEKGVCHRDLKPSNILLQIANQVSVPSDKSAIFHLESAIPKIIDFGLAKVFHEASHDAVTRSGAVFGTPRCMAPNRLRGKPRPSARPPIFMPWESFFTELLTGTVPFHGDTDQEVLRQVISDEASSPPPALSLAAARHGNHLSEMPGQATRKALRLHEQPGGRSPTVSRRLRDSSAADRLGGTDNAVAPAPAANSGGGRLAGVCPGGGLRLDKPAQLHTQREHERTVGGSRRTQSPRGRTGLAGCAMRIMQRKSGPGGSSRTMLSFPRCATSC